MLRAAKLPWLGPEELSTPWPSFTGPPPELAISPFRGPWVGGGAYEPGFAASCLSPLPLAQPKKHSTIILNLTFHFFPSFHSLSSDLVKMNWRPRQIVHQKEGGKFILRLGCVCICTCCRHTSFHPLRMRACATRLPVIERPTFSSLPPPKSLFSHWPLPVHALLLTAPLLLPLTLLPSSCRKWHLLVITLK